MRFTRTLLLAAISLNLVACSNQRDDGAVRPAHGVEILPAGNGMTVGIDNSGHGAVLCHWQFVVGLATYLDACHPDEDRALKDELAKGIEAINAFIIANSPTPVSKADLEARIARDRAPLQMMTTSQRNALCSARNSFARMRAELTVGQLKAWVADLLSVPRPPVMDPCL